MHIYPTAAPAEEIVAKLNADREGKDDFIYSVKVFENGRAIIEVRAESGLYLGNL